MNNLFKTTTGSSPGFVYFQTEPESTAKPEKVDGQDYIAFGDEPSSPVSTNKFSPRNYSSPQSGRGQCNNSPRYHHNNSRGGRFRQNRFSNQRFSFSPNGSRNSGHNFGRNEESFSRGAFMHPSFVEDPWAGLRPRRIRKADEEDGDESIDE